MSDGKTRRPELKLLMIIVERRQTDKLEDFLRDKQLRFHYMIDAMGTARSEVLKSLGLSGSDKTICICVINAGEAERLVSSVTDRFSLKKLGNGIICILPITGISAIIMELMESAEKERTETDMENPPEEKKVEPDYSLVVAVIDQGYSEVLMSAARSAGATGGTIINARHSGVEEAVKFFGVTLQAEKEVVAIVVPNESRSELMHAIGKKCGRSTEAHGAIISLPVESCEGITMCETKS